MSRMTETARGDIALIVLRFVVLGTGSALVGVLAQSDPPGPSPRDQAVSVPATPAGGC
jgi:hypothetical protein